MVGLGRFELPTSRLSGVRSNQLSYRPAGRFVSIDSRCRKSTQQPPAAALIVIEPGGDGSLKTEQERQEGKTLLLLARQRIPFDLR